jgi:hypothetical protein
LPLHPGMAGAPKPLAASLSGSVGS